MIASESLSELLFTAVHGNGTAGVSVLARHGALPQSVWLPSSAEEPAFLAYSISKLFTAVLFVRWAERQRLSLDDRLARWFPEVDRAERITLRQLLNHTAGIPDYGGLRSYQEALRSSPAEPWSFERFATETFARGLRFEPGRGWAYSNPGYLLLKQIAERVGGASYRALVAEWIVEPLGLTRTRVVESRAELAELAPAASTLLAADGVPRDVGSHYHPGWVSHGVIASTPSELVRFLDAVFQGGLVSESSLAELTDLVVVPAAPAPPVERNAGRWGRASYGLGLMADAASPWGVVLGHNGSGPGYGASAFFARDLGGACVCAMAAIEGFAAEEVVFSVFDRLAASAVA